jgi:hypothetical protein
VRVPVETAVSGTGVAHPGEALLLVHPLVVADLAQQSATESNCPYSNQDNR